MGLLQARLEVYLGMGLKDRLLLSPLYDWLGKRSYAQAGEDLLADILLDKPKNGFYVDVGAFHPKMFSNTYMFYKRGWRGVCVDPNPGMEEMYTRARPGDVFLNMGVGEKEGFAEYFMFDDPATNTFSKTQASKNESEAGRDMIKTAMVVTMPLKTIFEKYLPSIETEVDVLSVDVEGMDEEVLKSNDWTRFRPRLVICEDLDFDINNTSKSMVHKLMRSVGYKLRSFTPYSLIYMRSK